MKNRNSAGANRRPAGRRRQRHQSHKRSVMMISVVLLLLCGVLTVNSVTLQAKNDSYKEQEKELAEQIDDEKARTKEIEAMQDYIQSDEYTEKIAKEKIGLVKENEIIFKEAD